MKNLKLYEFYEFYPNYTYGLAIVLAENKEKAIELLKLKFESNNGFPMEDKEIGDFREWEIGQLGANVFYVEGGA